MKVEPKNLHISTRKEFPKLLKQLNLGGIWIEIGVWKGDFSEILMSGSPQQLISVDAWNANFCKAKWTQKDLDQAHIECKQRLSKFGEKSVIKKGTSAEVVKSFEDEFFDFIYIDAGHDYNNVKQDVSLWWPKLKKGGLFAGHDYFHRPNTTKEEWGVIPAIDEHMKNHNLKLYICEENGNKWKSWYCFKQKQ